MLQIVREYFQSFVYIMDDACASVLHSEDFTNMIYLSFLTISRRRADESRHVGRCRDRRSDLSTQGSEYDSFVSFISLSLPLV